MDPTQNFESQWKALQDEKEKINTEITLLQRKLKNLPVEPEMKQLLEKRDQFKKRTKELQDEIRYYECEINGKLNFLRDRRLAATDKRLQQKFALQLNNHRKRLANLKRLNAHQVIIQDEERMVWEIQSPIDEVAKIIQYRIAEKERERQKSVDLLNTILDYIKSIEIHYRQTKKSLKGKIKALGIKQRQIMTSLIEWSTQDIDNLVTHHQALSSKVPKVIQNNALNSRKKKRGPNHNTPDTTSMETNQSTSEPWRFWATFNANDQGQELPQEREQFIATLESILRSEDFNNLRADLVYQALMIFVSKGKQERKKTKRVKKKYMGQLRGCTIIDTTREHRLFLWFNEEKRSIRFLPRPRKEAYARR